MGFNCIVALEASQMAIINVRIGANIETPMDLDFESDWRKNLHYILKAFGFQGKDIIGLTFAPYLNSPYTLFDDATVQAELPAGQSLQSLGFQPQVDHPQVDLEGNPTPNRTARFVELRKNGQPIEPPYPQDRHNSVTLPSVDIP